MCARMPLLSSTLVSAGRCVGATVPPSAQRPSLRASLPARASSPAAHEINAPLSAALAACERALHVLSAEAIIGAEQAMQDKDMLNAQEEEDRKKMVKELRMP